MNQRQLYIFLFIIIASEGFAQKILQREWDASEIENLIINGDAVFQIKITSEKTTKIKLETRITGEYYENLMLSISVENKTLTLGTVYSPYFEPQNDKLAAHKIQAIEMNFTVPETLSVRASSKLASFSGDGTFKQVTVALDDGYCTLLNFRGNAKLQTKQGAIDVYALSEVEGTAISKHGIVENELKTQGIYHIFAESLNGDIRLFETK